MVECLSLVRRVEQARKPRSTLVHLRKGRSLSQLMPSAQVIWTFAISARTFLSAVFLSAPQPARPTATIATKNQRMRRAWRARVTAP
jgi:hypothetical protein